MSTAPDLIALMDALLAQVQRETELVRHGRLTEAGALAAEKSALAGRYLAESVRLKAKAGGGIGGDAQMLDELKRRQETFRAALQVNLAVLATAHAVAEGLIRGAATEAARRNAPQGYGARGHALAGPARAALPVALSRAY